MDDYRDDPYKILGVPKDATEQQVKTAYRKLALRHHPDKQTNEKAREQAQHKFAKISNAYEVLKDETLRREYDQSVEKASKAGKDGAKQPTGFRPVFHDPYEVFKNDFKEQFGIDYPGAEFDFIDPNSDDGRQFIRNRRMIEEEKQKKMIKGVQHKKMIGDDIPKREAASNTSASTNNKRSFNPFRRKSKKEENQLVVADKRKQQERQPGSQMVPYDANSSALVPSAGINNRPISMDTETKKEGKVTTTKITIQRPDGSTETVTMKTGLPGSPARKTKMIEGPKSRKLLENGKQKKQVPMITSGKKKPLLAIEAAEEHRSSSKPKRGLLGWGGKK